jgi:predicted GIY-YIG superfamily endonuclease|tara:strand:- start:827 stop:1231 length:405 start_codon:yes stop_codon:yes gene_type:complete
MKVNTENITVNRKDNPSEYKRQYRKLYHKATKLEDNAKSREYYKHNSKDVISQKKSYQNSRKHKPYVYLLPISNYVGVTERIDARMSEHRNKSNRNTDGFVIIRKCSSREEALIIEKSYHDKGYNGKHLNNKYS